MILYVLSLAFQLLFVVGMSQSVLPSPKFYDESAGSVVRSITEKSFDAEVRQNPGIVIVQFYSPNPNDCPLCITAKVEFEKSAAVLHGIVKFAAVDISVEKSVTEKLGLPKLFPLPSILMFGANEQNKNPLRYNGKIKSDDIVGEVLLQIKQLTTQRTRRLSTPGIETKYSGPPKGDIPVNPVIPNEIKVAPPVPLQPDLMGTNPNSDVKIADPPIAATSPKEVVVEKDDENVSRVITLTDDNFKSLVIDSDDHWLVDFYAPWYCITIVLDVDRNFHLSLL